MIEISSINSVAVLRINNPPVNVLSEQVARELLLAIQAADRDPNVTAIVVMGAGKTFVAGADIRALERATLGDLDAACDMHDTLARIENCAKPLVMAIHGNALGGGLELAMAARYRVAVADALLGQPEVNLGIIPGAEATQRLPRLVGVANALDMCVTGKPRNAAQALDIGLIDRLVEGDLIKGAVAFAAEVVAWPQRPKTRDRIDRLGTAAENGALFAAARDLAARVRPGEAAPIRVIEAIEAATVWPFDAGCRREREILVECLESDQARSMIRAFFERKRARQPKPGRRLRPVRVENAGASIDRRPDGTTYVRPKGELGAYADTLCDRLDHWARQAPDRPFLADRAGTGNWTITTYAQMHGRVHAVAQALVDRQLSADRPIAILSGNSIDHATLALAAMHAGVPYAPISPAYSLLSRDHEALKYIFGIFRPGLVFVEDPDAFESALQAVLTPDAELVTSLPSSSPGSSVDAARAAIGPDMIAKILFTSGSTGRPKGVINTQRMLCSNQEMIRSRLAVLTDAPPVLCDWLPWNHTFGGNHNFGLVLYNGGTLHIDRGRPAPQAFDETVRNLRDVSPTVYFNVPRGYEMLVQRLRDDAQLRQRFFARLQLVFFAAAGLTQRVWDELQDLAVDTCGEEILMITGLGSTESAPAALFTDRAGAASGWIGLPLPGVDVKLAPVGPKIEARFRGPSITSGYWRDEPLTASAFDDEGFYRTGDAVRWVDPATSDLGLMFDGRLNEDFKLSTGTWVSVGPLRAKVLLHFAGLLQDIVIAGPDRETVGGLLFPAQEVRNQPDLRSRLCALLKSFADAHPASSMHVSRAMVMDDPPSFEAGEITDKGSLNQKTVMKHRAPLVDELYWTPTSPRVLRLDDA